MTSRPAMIAVIPAHNEAENLPSVVADLRRRQPDLEILVVDDGSSDRTVAVLKHLQVRWLHWPERRGVGSALRAGVRYASQLGAEFVVRVDADGQHDADEVARLLRPLRDGSADVVLGSRYVADGHEQRPAPGVVKRVLAALVSVLSRRAVTDPTSGFWALGPRAVSLLADHHPAGYPEPELHLFLSRNALRVVEVRVQSRPRLSGRSSLTATRLMTASARLLLAMLIVPLRASVGPTRD